MKPVLALFALIAVAAANCPPLWTSGGDKCYKYFQTPTTLTEAENICMDFGNCNGEMGQLLEIQSHQETTFLNKYLSMFAPLDQPILPIWVNLRLIENPNGQSLWRWEGSGLVVGAPGGRPGGQSTVPVYTNFGTPTLPNDGRRCVRTNRPNTPGVIMPWVTSQCNAQFGFVCEMPSGLRSMQQQPRQPTAVNVVQTSGRLTQGDTVAIGQNNPRQSSRL